MLENTIPYDDHANFVHVDWHYSGYFANPAAIARKNYLGANSGAPDTYFDGTNNILGAGDSVQAYNQYKPIVDSHYAAQSKIILDNVLLDFDCATGMGAIDFDVEIAPGETVNNIGSVSVRVAVYEASILTPVFSEPRTGRNEWNNIGRLMPVEVSLTVGTSGQIQNVAQQFAIDPSWNVQELAAIAFVQRDSNKAILQAGLGARMFDFDHVNNDPLEAKTVATMVEWDADVTYLGALDDDVVITIDTSDLPAGWTTQVIHGIDAHPTTLTIPNMTLGQQENYRIRVTPGDDTPAGGKVQVSVAPASNPNSCFAVSTTYSVFNNTEAILIVNDDNGDGHGAGTAMEGAVAAAGHYSVLREVAVEGNPEASDLSFYDAVIWSTGFLSSNTIGASHQANLSAYLDAGGKFALFSHGYLNHQGVTPFTSGYLGVSGFVQDQQALSCTGVPGEIADGISFVTSGPFADFSDTQTPAAGAVAWLEGHLSNTVGVRYAPGAFQSVFTTVAFELMTPPAGDQVMDRILEWFFPSGGTGVTPSETRLSFALAQNAPNPFRARTSVGFALPQDGLVKLSVYNVAGQKVVDLANRSFPAGQHTVTWDGRDAQGSQVASGVYLYRLEALDGTLTREMVRLK